MVLWAPLRHGEAFHTVCESAPSHAAFRCLYASGRRARPAFHSFHV